MQEVVCARFSLQCPVDCYVQFAIWCALVSGASGWAWLCGVAMQLYLPRVAGATNKDAYRMQSEVVHKTLEGDKMVASPTVCDLHWYCFVEATNDIKFGVLLLFPNINFW